MKDAWLDSITWNSDGLVPVITQDVSSKRILTHAWANREAVARARAEGRAVYWSRSRGRLWRKGEESGHIQRLHEILLDCDGDTLCYQVEQVGGIACHTGRESCFYRRLDDDGNWRVDEPVIREPEQIYGDSRPQGGSA